MANLTIKGKNLKSNLISISDKPIVMDSGAKLVWVGYDHSGSPKNLVLQTPQMSLPFGMNSYEEGEYPKYSTELSFGDLERDKNLKAFYDNMGEFDEHLIDAGVKNSMAWFKKKKASKEVIDAMYNRCVKVPMDKETGEELTQYPKRLRVKLPFKDGKFECKVFDTSGNEITDKPMADVLARGAKVKAIIQCVGMWVSASNYMCQWKLLRAEVDVPEGKGSYDFLPDTDDEDGDEEVAVTKAPVTKAEVKSTVVNDSEDEEEDDDDDDEDDEDDEDDDDDDDDEESEPEPEPEPEPPKKKGRGKGKSKSSK